uniref:Family with sequence similarity 168 member B n=1 Tax=Paramormyrops kingsleyae TaxID=1676925 RepID=A0A3B3R900_9TELE
MNPVYSPASTGVPYSNPKGIGYPAATFPVGYAATVPAYSPSMYPGTSTAFQTGYTPGTPYKMSCSPTTGTVPPYSSSPNPYQAAVYPVRSAYPQQNPYAQQGAYYSQPLYAAPPQVIHHTTVVQPNGMPAAMYAPPIPPPRANSVPMGMVAGTTMAMSAGRSNAVERCSVTYTCLLVLNANAKHAFSTPVLLRDPADDSFPDSSGSSPSHDAYVPPPRYPHLQLCAPPVVKGQ